MNIIALETASTICGVSLFMDNEIIDKDEIDKPRVHGQRLPVIVKNLLNKNRVKITNLDGIAISSGPGSYTGLRIGMSFSKGLAASSELPIIPVPTLLGINYNINIEGGYCIMLHSHKEFVYSQNYFSGKAITEIVCEDYKFKKGALVYGFNLDDLDINFHLAHPSSEAVGKIAIEKFMDWKQDKINKVSPNYITSI